MNIGMYTTGVLLVVLLSFGWFHFTEVDGLKSDIADIEKLNEKLRTKTDELRLGIQMLENAEELNNKAIEDLIDETVRLNDIAGKTSQNHRAEVAKYKKLLKAMQEDVEIMGDVFVENCMIEMQEVNDEASYIGKSVSRIGF